MNNQTIVSEIQFLPVKPQDGLVGFATFVLDKKYYVGSVAVYTRLSGGGYRLVYPAKKVGDRNINTFHPIDQNVGMEIEKIVSEKVARIFAENYDRSERYN